MIRRTVVHKVLCVDCWTASQQLEELSALLKRHPYRQVAFRSVAEAGPTATWSPHFNSMLEFGGLCFNCGRWFSVDREDSTYRLRYDARYCSNACRQAMYRLRVRLRAGHPLSPEKWKSIRSTVTWALDPEPPHVNS
ncbi:hypothetical protein EFN39_10550 [Propionibacterium freudenreichii]|nr:hypothetical protein [Propionibacterium freudenreichii]MCT3014744.1 hypothetical protein [Propionibacterium freudenreichii]MCT3018545.1 hypothetical protein [Propionibacterium freudenreichii]SCQ62840.1 Hypothetical protein PFR_JS15-1_425 [Propionibacterium freudenreichii]SCQ72294.1 Hypothetical protein PFR_JS15-2_428 [Propionibacterium freudenreichii]